MNIFGYRLLLQTVYMAQYLTFSRFFTEAEAQPLVDILKREAIPYSIEQEVNQLDPIYIGQTLDPMITVKIAREQFKKVNQLIEKEAEAQPIASDHYLNDFTSTELLNILKSGDEWNAYDRAYAKKLLTVRNVPIAHDMRTTPEEVFEPVRLETKWIIAGYAFALTSVLGIFMSLPILNSHKTLQNGTRVKMYDSYTLKHAGTILIISCFGLMVFIYRLYLRDYRLI